MEGIEPSIFCMSSRRVIRYTTRALEVRVGFEPTMSALQADVLSQT